MSAPEPLPDYALVLVAIMPNQRDLDIARLWLVSHPLKSAPKVIAVDYWLLSNRGLWQQPALADTLPGKGSGR